MWHTCKCSSHWGAEGKAYTRRNVDGEDGRGEVAAGAGAGVDTRGARSNGDTKSSSEELEVVEVVVAVVVVTGVKAKEMVEHPVAYACACVCACVCEKVCVRVCL